jgi:cytochrome oxidase Cu insertion factor (SCO1/SenC/PrrC family)
VGLRGTEEETDRVTRAFAIEYRLLHYKDQVLVDHSAHGYLIDPAGRTRVRIDYDMAPAEIAQDVRAVLRGP